MENKNGDVKKPELVGRYTGKSYLFFITTDKILQLIFIFWGKISSFENEKRLMALKNGHGNDLFGEMSI